MSLRSKNKLYPTSLFSLVLVLALSACGDDSGDDGDDGNDERDSGSGTSDAGRDSGGSGMDGSVEAGPRDAASDSSTTPPRDSSTTDATTADTGVADSGSTPTPMTLNGCAPANYEDVSGSSAAVINFGGSPLGNNYDPKCATVNLGQVVRFVGNFGSHSLRKGSPGSPNAGSPNNPIVDVDTGSMREFTFTAAGTYPYFCQQHQGINMVGAIFVK